MKARRLLITGLLLEKGELLLLKRSFVFKERLLLFPGGFFFGKGELLLLKGEFFLRAQQVDVSAHAVDGDQEPSALISRVS